MNSDISLKEVEVLIGNLRAIHSKLGDKEKGAIVQLESILEKIDPMVINFSGKLDKQELNKSIQMIENLLKMQQSQIETTTAKYYVDAKELAEKLIGKGVDEAVVAVNRSKDQAIREISSINIEEHLKINYMIVASVALIGIALGFVIGSFT